MVSNVLTSKSDQKNGLMGWAYMLYLLYDQVTVNSLERFVWLGLQDENDVTRLHFCILSASLTPEGDLAAVLVALLYVDFEYLLLRLQALYASTFHEYPALPPQHSFCHLDFQTCEPAINYKAYSGM